LAKNELLFHSLSEESTVVRRCRNASGVKIGTGSSARLKNQQTLIISSSCSMKVPWKFHEIRDQHRFKIVLIQSQPALSQPRLGRFAGNARWRPPESAV
jgi:hypothetical protein